MWPSNPTTPTWHIPWKKCNSQRHVHPSVHRTIIYNSQDKNEWMKIWVCVYVYVYTHTHTQKYYSAIKRNEIGFFVDGTRDHQTEWSKSEREKQALYTKASTWDLEKWSRWTCLMGSSRDTGAEDGHVDMGVGREVGRTGAWGWHAGTAVCETIPSGNLPHGTDAQLRALWSPGREGWAEGGGVCTHTWSLSCTAEPNNTVKQLYPSLKSKQASWGSNTHITENRS